ncbi:MAG: hypothetical protein RQ824_00855 [bacterium]|nr:hypothetical protein [bacterium]
MSGNIKRDLLETIKEISWKQPRRFTGNFQEITQPDSSNHEFVGKVIRIVSAVGGFSFDNIPGMGVEFKDSFCNLESIIT